MKKIKNWMDSHYLKERMRNPNIEVGEFTYYSGYYHEKEFEDQCVRYLLGDGSTKNYREIFGEKLEFDKLRIGRFCSIGSGAVIGSRALVAKDVEPYSIVGGNPAREIRKRFTDKEIEMLLEVKWWEWDVEVIDKNLEYICSSNIEGFYGRFKLMEKN